MTTKIQSWIMSFKPRTRIETDWLRCEWVVQRLFWGIYISEPATLLHCSTFECLLSAHDTFGAHRASFGDRRIQICINMSQCCCCFEFVRNILLDICIQSPLIVRPFRRQHLSRWLFSEHVRIIPKVLFCSWSFRRQTNHAWPSLAWLLTSIWDWISSTSTAYLGNRSLNNVW